MARMNIMFYNEKTGEQIIFPINPESVVLPHSKSNATFELLGYGEINIMGEKQLMRITLEHFLPDEKTLLGQFANIIMNTIDVGYSAQRVIKMLRQWDNDKARIRVVIDTEVNKVFDILSFDETVRENSTARPYKLELIEYRNPKEEKSTFNKLKQGLKQRIFNLPTPKEKIMVTGETLYSTAKRYNLNWKSLANINNISDVNANLMGDTLNFIGAKALEN